MDFFLFIKIVRAYYQKKKIPFEKYKGENKDDM